MSDLHKLPADYRMTYRGLTLNDHRDASGDFDRDQAEDCYDVTYFDFSALSVRDQVEGLHLDSGADLGVASKEYRRLALRGLIKGSTAAKLEDRVAKLFNAFDVEEAQRDDPTTEGISAFTFWCPTDDPPSGLSSPVQEQFMARPRGFPVVYERKSQGLAYMFAAELICADPRRYVVTAESIVFSSGDWTKAMPNWSDGQGVIVYPVLTIVMSGAGDSDLTISDGTTDLVLDMSGETAGTFTVDMGTCDIKKGTTMRADLRTSEVDTFYGVAPGGSSWTITNTTGVTSVTAAYRPARS